MISSRVEEISLVAWPALEQTVYDGWVVRFARGYTKRANSVTPLYPSRLGLVEKIASCEAMFAVRGLPPIFRLTSFERPPGLEAELDRRGYATGDLSLVLGKELDGEGGNAGEGGGVRTATRIELRVEPLDAWLAGFCALSGVPLASHATHGALIRAIRPRHLLAALAADGEVVARGRAVLGGDLVGLFDLVTAPAHRRRGFGSRLVAALLAWGRGYGARAAYLQVLAGNDPALEAYTRAGFSELYRYDYRSPPAR